MIDTTVGPYRLLRRLGAGGMGEVYLAEDSRLRRQVALKRLTDRTLCGAEVRARILREARAAGKLQHPGIAAVFDVVEDGEAVWIVMEYVPGETLAARLKRDRLPVDAALGIGTQIAEALAHAHAHGVVHCDLKPSNVQLTPDGRVRVLDFGLAQRPERALAAEETRLRSLDVSQADSGRVTGTAGYMAPERLRGLRPDERSDVYSLGVVLFQLLTGRKPFAGTDLVAVAAAALSAPAPAASSVEPEIPGAVSLVVSRALSADPAARFASATELVMALRAATGAGASSGSAARHPLVARVAVPVALTVLILSGVGVLAGFSRPGARRSAGRGRQALRQPQRRRHERLPGRRPGRQSHDQAGRPAARDGHVAGDHHGLPHGASEFLDPGARPGRVVRRRRRHRAVRQPVERHDHAAAAGRRRGVGA
jgi:tRNA A-37 threonylcarbamoyl transferase component Bud32